MPENHRILPISEPNALFFSYLGDIVTRKSVDSTPPMTPSFSPRVGDRKPRRQEVLQTVASPGACTTAPHLGGDQQAAMANAAKAEVTSPAEAQAVTHEDGLEAPVTIELLLGSADFADVMVGGTTKVVTEDAFVVSIIGSAGRVSKSPLHGRK